MTAVETIPAVARTDTCIKALKAYKELQEIQSHGLECNKESNSQHSERIRAINYVMLTQLAYLGLGGKE